ncbi:MAG: hypothetical protein Q9219_003512 [cf. Caloplaca sp. 3 TL-2023]
MNLAEALFQYQYNDRFTLHQHIIYSCWREDQSWYSEIFFTRLAQGYTTNGGGFNHYGAGFSNGSSYRKRGMRAWERFEKQVSSDTGFKDRLQGVAERIQARKAQKEKEEHQIEVLHALSALVASVTEAELAQRSFLTLGIEVFDTSVTGEIFPLYNRCVPRTAIITLSIMTSDPPLASSVAASSNEHVKALTQSLVDAIKSATALIEEGAEAAREAWMTTRRDRLAQIVEFGNNAVKELDNLTNTYQQTTVDFDKLRISLLEAYNGEQGKLTQLKEQQGNAQAANEESKRSANEIEKALKQLEQELSSRRNDLNSATSALENTKSEDAALKSAMEEQQRQQIREDTRLKEWAAYLDGKSKEHDTTDSRLTAFQDDLERAREEHNTRMAAILDRENEATRASGHNITIRRALEQALEAMRGFVGFLRPINGNYSIAEEVNRTIDAVNTKLTTHDLEVTNQKTIVQMHLHTIKSKEETINRSNKQMQSLQREKRNLDAETENLRSSIAALQNELDQMQSLQGEKQELEAEMDNLRRSISTLQNDLETSRFKTKEFEQSATRFSRQVQSIRSAHEATDSQNVQNSLEIKRLQQLREEQDASLRSVTDECTKFEDQARKKAEELLASESRATVALGEKQDLQVKLTEAGQTLKFRQEEIKSLESKLTAGVQKLSSAEDQLQKKHDQVFALENSVRDLTNLNQTSKEEIARLQDVEREADHLRAQKSSATWQAEVDALNFETEQQQGKLEEQEALIFEHQETIEKRTSELNAIQKKLATLQEKQNQLGHTLGKAKAKLYKACNPASEESGDPEIGFWELISSTIQFINYMRTVEELVFKLHSLMLPEKERVSRMEMLKDIIAWVAQSIRQKSTLEQERDSSREQVSVTAEQLSALRTNNATLEAQAGKVPTLEQHLRELKASHETALGNKNREAATFREQHNRLKAEIEAKTKQIAQLDSDLKAYASKNSNLEAQIKRLSTNLDAEANKTSSLEEQLSTMRHKNDQLEADLTTATVEAQNASNLLRHNLALITEERDRLKLQHTAVATEVDKESSLARQLSDLGAEHEQLETRYKAAHVEAEKVSGLTQQLSIITNERDQLQAENSRAVEEASRASTLLSDMEGKHNQLESRRMANLLRESSKREDHLVEKVSQLEDNEVTIQRELNYLTTRNAQQKSRLQKNDSDINLLRNQVASLEEERDDLRKQLEAGHQQPARMKVIPKPPGNRGRPRKTALNVYSSRNNQQDEIEDTDDGEEIAPPSKRVKFINPANRGIARQPSIHSIDQQPRNPQPDMEPWYDVEDMEQPDFWYGNLPAAIFDIVRQQMKRWDYWRQDWYFGAKSGQPKCANRWARKWGSTMEHGFACDNCVKDRLVCLAVKKNELQIRCLRPEERGQATPAEMGYWVMDHESMVE